MIKADTDEQLLTVSRLADEIWHEYFPCILTAEQIDYMVEKFQSFPAMKSQVEKGYSYYIISRNGEYLGYTAVCPEEDGLFLSKLYLKKENRGKGYARQAFEFLKKLCAEKGYKFIRLTVNKYNADTIAVYEKLGFELLRSEVTDIGNGYVMDDFVYIYNMKG
ncbi:MAG: GNAT family N-acetyltransferase [Ruminococcus sp.]|nr:GNAT family N-acetyltransferase [Ruminococcus sp.]